MKIHARKFKASYLFGIALLGIALAVALVLPPRAAADDDDPPSRVARLSYAHGNVSFEPAGTDDWVEAVVNRPVTTGDRLWSDNGGRAELELGSASIRLADATGFSFLNLSDNVTQLQLTQGSMRVRVKRLDRDETFEIDTPNLAFSVLRPGIYRINVNEGGDTTVVQVREGQGEVTGGGTEYDLQSGQVGRFSGTDRLYADVEGYGGGDDDFDNWSADRDRREERAVSARYVSSDVVGYSDLDDYGDWHSEGEYGMVWFPRTRVAGWAPYHYGHWAYIYPWGYTWVDDEPWGFAPFHYGRWVNVSGAWGWVPCPPRAEGVVYVRPVYAPALVAWVGGPHFGAGVSVGWFPLGPREVYVPSYPVSRRYVTNVNISNTTVNTTVVNNYYNTTVINKTTVVNQTFVNQRVPGAVAATTSRAFTSAQPVARNMVTVNQRDVVSAPVNVATPSIPPGKQAVLGTGATTAAKPPATLLNRQVVAKTQPPPPPVPFARQQQAIEANGGKPPAISQVRQIQATNAQTVHAEVKIAPPAKLAMPKNAQGANMPGSNAPANNAQGNKTGQPQGAPNGGNQPGQGQANFGNKPGNAGGNAGNPNTGGRTFEDRPPSARPNGGNAQGQPTVDNKQGNPSGNTGNPNAGRRTFEDRPPSPQPKGGNVQGQPTVDNKQANPSGNTGNPNTGRRTFEDRSQPPRPNGGNAQQAQPSPDNRPGNAGGNIGNSNTGRRTFEEQPSPSARPNGGNPPPPPPKASNPTAEKPKPPDQQQQEQKKQPPPDKSKADQKKKDDHPDQPKL